MTDCILNVQDLCKSFGAVKASKNLSFNIRRGDVHALIGPNGAGKTTIVNLLSGDIQPDSGTILFDGTNISRMKPYDRATIGLGRSFQITSIFENMSVAENLSLSIIANGGHNFKFWRNCTKSPLVKRELPSALERIGLVERAEFPARHLSHGEKKQLEVGMTLAGNPKLLMLDEPMAGMGPGGSVEMSKLIQRLKGDITILLVEHDMEVVFSLADRITVIVYGESIAHGTPEEIRNNVKVRSAYLGDE